MNPAHEALLAQVARSWCAASGFAFDRVAGHGAFKATYRAVHPTRGALAVKVYLPGAVSERAIREIEALTALTKARHPSLPSFIALGEHEHAGARYLVSVEDFLGGGSLSERLGRRGPCTRDEVVAIARQIGSAVGVVAGQGLVHRDIKPDNIVFRDDGTAVLVDFGLVRDLSQQSLTQTWLAQGPGTPLFAAPEQLRNEKHLIDWRTDQFALGVSLSFAGLGQHPYAHPGDTFDAVVGRVAAREQPYGDFAGMAAASGLPQLVRMVAPWPIGRFRTTADLLAAWQ